MLVETVQAFEKGECSAIWYCSVIMLLVRAVFSCATNSTSALFIFKPVHECNMSFPELKQKNELTQEKQHTISHLVSEINQKQMQKDNILAKIQKLREEQAKRQEGTFLFGRIA